MLKLAAESVFKPYHINSLEKETIEKREFEIVNNIYKLSRENSYSQALLFIGSGHKKSIFKMIKNLNRKKHLPRIGFCMTTSSKRLAKLVRILISLGIL